MRKNLAFIVLLGCALLFVPATASAQETIKAFVTSEGADSGFSAGKGANDSVLDLARALGNKRRLSVVNTAEGADIVIEVESRDSHWDTGGVYAYKPRKGGHTAYFTTTKKVRTVYATLKVEDYSHQFHGEAALWSAAAGRVADQIDKWVEQNLVKLIELRQHRQ